ncbi:hypothetical protein [Tropicimonas isoalkanivorans]|uniref:Uncharacterized protein n=1 Tax=Tropicimonas isoalkanivorans TaxID=441112 RepID=A0A1I1E614_9RHOB|nr:hypothetical protein [Tropicimonas isoalkanivorans]SFB82092.1 hypothetical protein SAMN04488094_101636 [Tropicimonas isoalkanivorans]
MSENTEAPRPVADWENREVRGDVIVTKSLYDHRAAKVAKLRQRQEAYEASLPKKKGAALREIADLMGGLVGDLDEEAYAVHATLELLGAMASGEVFTDGAVDTDVLYWLVSRAREGLADIERKTRRAKDIAAQFSPLHQPYKA